ncbi:MAG: hypothetical protein HQM08_03800 [Candidatus Riflebacteria bacterium]|nr:hypothetical protein [Candidatus Riflebacteria bacterium]
MYCFAKNVFFCNQKLGILHSRLFPIWLFFFFGSLIPVFSCNGVYEGKYCTQLGIDPCACTELVGTPTIRPEEPFSPPQLNTGTVEALIDSKAPLILVVASLERDNPRIIPGSQKLDASLPESEINKLLPQKDRMILIYDADPASKIRYDVFKKLKDLGYSNLIDFSEGLTGWINKGRKVENLK